MEEKSILRHQCSMCVTKHLGSAMSLMVEALTKSHDNPEVYAYPWHVIMAIGELAQAEQECMFDYPELSAEIRLTRLHIHECLDENRFGDLANIPMEDLLIKACLAFGYECVRTIDPNNSKRPAIFDAIELSGPVDRDELPF